MGGGTREMGFPTVLLFGSGSQFLLYNECLAFSCKRESHFSSGTRPGTKRPREIYARRLGGILLFSALANDPSRARGEWDMAMAHSP